MSTHLSPPSPPRPPPPTPSPRQVLIENTVRLHVLKAIGTACRDAGVRLVAIKGMSLLGREYPDLSQRRMSDIDVLIRPRDEARAKAALLAARAVKLDEPTTGRPFAYHFSYGYTWGATQTLIELHTGFSYHDWFHIDIDRIIAAAEPHPLEDLATAGIYRPRPEHQLLAAAIHRIKHAYLPDPRDVNDALHIIAHNVIDESLLVHDAHDFGLSIALNLFARVAHAEAARQTTTDASTLALLDRIATATTPPRPRRLALDAAFDPTQPNPWRIHLANYTARVYTGYLLTAPSLRTAISPAVSYLRWKLRPTSAT